MERINIISRSEKEIVFSSVEDLSKFWEEVSNGKTVILIRTGEGETEGILLNPNNAPQINDGQIILRSFQKTKRS